MKNMEQCMGKVLFTCIQFLDLMICGKHKKKKNSMMHVHIRRKAERAMKNGQSREMGNIGNKTQNEDIHTK